MFSTRSLVTLTAFAVLAVTACGPSPNKNQPTQNSPGLMQGQVGTSFTLQTVTYTTTTMQPYRASDHPGFAVTMMITSDKTISGRMFCNPFTAGAIWSSEHILYPSNYSVAATTCGAGQPANPISFADQEMYFTFNDNGGLTISDFANTYHAYFTSP